jgi:Ca2+/Na+ antiporter
MNIDTLLGVLRPVVVMGNMAAVVIILSIMHRKMKDWAPWKRVPLMFFGGCCFIAIFSSALREQVYVIAGMITLIAALAYSLFVVWTQQRIDHQTVVTARNLCTSASRGSRQQHAMV